MEPAAAVAAAHAGAAAPQEPAQAAQLARRHGKARKVDPGPSKLRLLCRSRGPFLFRGGVFALAKAPRRRVKLGLEAGRQLACLAADFEGVVLLDEAPERDVAEEPADADDPVEVAVRLRKRRPMVVVQLVHSPPRELHVLLAHDTRGGQPPRSRRAVGVELEHQPLRAP
jgi:hypothetical protein